MRIAVVQTRPVFGEPATNVAEALRLMEGAPADLHILPELFNTGYNFIDKHEAFSLGEDAQGKTFAALVDHARRRGCHIVYGFAERAGNNLYNSSAIAGPGGLEGLYRKVHLYARENLFFTPGDLGFPVFDLPMGRIGMMICFDWIYPESTRALALKGAQLIAHPSNLVMPHCPDAMVTRCLENRIFTATADRTGTEDRGGLKLTFIGKSEIVSPRGQILKRMGGEETGVAMAEVNLGEAENKKINEFNDLLAGRRLEQY